VTARDDSNGDRYLCAYIVVKHKTPASGLTIKEDQEKQEIEGADLEMLELREYLSQVLPDYMVPSYIVPIEAIPLNPSGKTDLRALPEPETGTAGTQYIAPRDELEEKLAHIWSEILNIEKTQISINNNFFEMGGHSLKATILMSRIYKELDVKITLEEIFKNLTIKQQARTIESKKKEKYVSLEVAEQKDYYELSSAQKRIYILQQMDESNTGYNIFETVLLEGELKKEKLEKNFRQLIARHESLRTSFHMIGGEPVQVVHENSDINYSNEYYETKCTPGEDSKGIMEIVKAFIRPFDLTGTPLLRVGIVKTGNTHSTEPQHILMVDMHHIVSDGISIGIIINDFTELYSGGTLPQLKHQYKDFSQWQKNETNREIL
ncbi:MAG: hypothetical protein GY757_25100, partial [bacterium]|nr:hypothetical protein [bacterium]